MKKIQDLKDKATTIAGAMILFSGAIFALEEKGISVPELISNISVIAGTVGATIIAFFTGKNADGTKKSSSQIDAQK